MIFGFRSKGSSMKSLKRDISLTLVIKFILLFLLWWFCVRTMHPTLEKSQDWFLGNSKTKINSNIKR